MLPLLCAAMLLAPPAARPDSLPSPRVEPEAASDALRALALIGAGEPGIAAVQSAAAREAERRSPGATGFPRRARLAALLPRLTAEYRIDERSYRVVGLQGSGEVDYLRQAPGSAFLVRATWDLGGLVAARGELAGINADASRARSRDDAVRRATTLFFERRRMRLALLLDPPVPALARAQAELEVDRVTAELDALTGGSFTGGGHP